MHYTYDVLVLPSHKGQNWLEVPIKLSAGIIKHVSIIFQRGCANMVHCVLWSSAEQLLPTNTDGDYACDGYVVEADCYIPTWIHGNEFYVLAWNDGTYYQHLIRVLIDVQGVDEPDLGDAAAMLNKTTESLTAALKELYV